MHHSRPTSLLATPGNALEFFSGSGGMAEGFRRAGVEFDLAVDRDADACDAYKKNLGKRPVRVDIRDLTRLGVLGGAWPAQLALLVADPPCAPWARAGKRRGLDDPRDMLAATVDRIAQWKPLCWLIGNMPGLDDAPNAGALQRTLGRLLNHDYCMDYASLDAADYGVPQHCVRPFWFGHPIGTACIAWPMPTHGSSRRQLQIAGIELAPLVTVRQALARLSVAELGKPIRVRMGAARHVHPLSELARTGGTILSGQPNNCGNALALGCGDHRPSDLDAPARTLTCNTHSDGALIAHMKHPMNEPNAPSYTITRKGCGLGAQGACVVTWPWDRPSTTLTTRDSVSPFGRSAARGASQSANAIKLSERAALIRQGFPDDWTAVGKTKAARWAQIGQAVPPQLAAAVARSVVAWMHCSSAVSAEYEISRMDVASMLDEEVSCARQG
jgi:site-specific DNA-cytosine methylase